MRINPSGDDSDIISLQDQQWICGDGPIHYGNGRGTFNQVEPPAAGNISGFRIRSSAPSAEEVMHSLVSQLNPAVGYARSVRSGSGQPFYFLKSQKYGMRFIY